MTIRQKAINGVKWTSINFIGKFAITFILSIVLARELTPREFGITGMLSVFLAIANVFVNSGFISAIIRGKDVSDRDYSSVFFFNIIIGGLFYLILLIATPSISNFYDEPILMDITPITSLVFLIASFGLVQNAILIKRMNFRSQTKYNLIGLFISALISIYMALNNYGIYSIVFQPIIQSVVTTSLLWYYSDWRPSLIISKASFQKLWPFSSKILSSSIIGQVVSNIDSVLIGKLFSAYSLGIFTRAKSTIQLPEQITSGVLGTVSFSILSHVNDDPKEFKRVHLKLFQLGSFVIFPMIIGLMACSHSFIEAIYTSKWIEAVPFIQILGIIGIANFFAVLFSQSVMALGMGTLYLKINTIKQILGLLPIPFGIFFGLTPFVIMISVVKLIGFLIDVQFVGKLMALNFKSYFNQLARPLFFSSIMGISVYLFGEFSFLSPLLTLVIQLIFGFAFYTISARIFMITELKYLLELIKRQKN